MRANIPREKTHRNTLELGGEYLSAMQKISGRLMNVLPDGDYLWGVLGQAEALLLEAQMMGTSPEDLFPQGGVEGFCQSIIDEYREREGIPPEEDLSKNAASQTHKKSSEKTKRPRGGVNAKRHRRITGLLGTAAVLVLAVLAVVYSGFYRFVTQGSGFYHEELHNFENTFTEERGEPLSFEVTLSPITGLGQILYVDGEGYTVSLDGVSSQERTVAAVEDGKTVVRKVTSWSMTLYYTVDASFTRIRTVTPTPRGSATLTLSDGRVFTGELTADSSGPLKRGFEYIRITFLDLPSNLRMGEETVQVTMEPPTYRLWERTGMGSR